MKRSWLKIAGVGMVVLALAVWIAYRWVQSSTAVPRGLDDYYVYVSSGSSFEEVEAQLIGKGLVTKPALFRQLAREMEYVQDPMRSGRYEVKPGWSMVKLIRHLRNGEQAPVRLVLTNARLPEDVAEAIAEVVEPTAEDLMALWQDEAYLKELGYTPETFMSLFIPNTYELFWNVSPRGVVNRMVREHKAFWEREDRLDKAEKLGMDPVEVYTLASIVEKETNQNEEKPAIAGVYLNRLRKNIRLQADPTAVFARRDFDARRVTWYHTKYDSPYNTYMYSGLPPGPICMASIASIDAVLQAESHDYLFFCARGDGSGLHAFAKTLAGHNQNAQRYRRNLRRRGKR